MASGRSPFLEGALGWLYGDTIGDRCARCGYEWTTDHVTALEAIASSPARYAALVSGRDATVPAPAGGWNAVAYLWHLTDLARSWSERWVQVSNAPGSLLVGWDPDALAAARNYPLLPTVSALWALPAATDAFVALSRSLDASTPFLHGDWGPGTVADAMCWLAHEYVHHQLDVDERARPFGDAAAKR
jgi:hypothetical protein